MRPLQFKTPEDLEQRIIEYFDYLEESNNPPTIAGLCYYTRIPRRTFYNYENKEAYADVLYKTRDFIIMKLEELAISKSSSAGGIIFLLKNNGYSDRQTLEYIDPPTINVIWE